MLVLRHLGLAAPAHVQQRHPVATRLLLLPQAQLCRRIEATTGRLDCHQPERPQP